MSEPASGTAGDVHVVLDLSDIVIQILSGGSLGGIVRVVAQIARCIPQVSTGDDVTLVFFHPGRRDYVRIAPELFAGEEWANGDGLRLALGLIKVPVPFAGTRYFGRPVQRAYHIFRRRLKYRLEAWRAERPVSTKAEGWAISSWSPPTTGKVRIAALGMAWMVPRQFQRQQQLARKADVEIVTLIHDLIPIIAPEGEATPNEAFQHWFAHLARHTSRYVAVSQFTARTVEEVAPRYSGHIDWVRPVALAHEFQSDGTRDASVVPSGEFVLAVGSLGHKRKNLDVLLKVWGRLYDEIGRERLPALVLAGAHGKEIAKAMGLLASYPGLADKIVFVERPNDAQLAALYAACLFTVYPSLFEGFGLPVGESAWFGKLCLASNVSSIPEVIGKGADYFDPISVDDMAEKLARPMLDRAYLAARERDVAGLSLRRWSDVARDLVAALKA